MENMMNRVFRRTGRVRISAGEKTLNRRGVVMPMEGGMKLLQPFTAEPCGSLTVPLYRYLGDAEELLDWEDAHLKKEKEEYRVLQAALVTGHAGKVYVEALLERVMTDDGP